MVQELGITRGRESEGDLVHAVHSPADATEGADLHPIVDHLSIDGETTENPKDTALAAAVYLLLIPPRADTGTR